MFSFCSLFVLFLGGCSIENRGEACFWRLTATFCVNANFELVVLQQLFWPALNELNRKQLVEPHELVKKSGGLEKASVHWHAVAYANKIRADGHVETILPKLGVFRKRQNGRGQHHHP